MTDSLDLLEQERARLEQVRTTAEELQVERDSWAARALEMLKELEWDGTVLVCPFCFGAKGAGHRSDCRLDALIKEKA